MSCDLFTLNALAYELNSTLEGGRVDKITQPETDEVCIFARSKGKNHCLVVSCNAQAPRIHITAIKKQNPANAPAFCMLLRKHLIGAKIENIAIYEQDRTVRIEFLGKTEMQDEAKFYLYVELMNRYSNIILTDSQNVILDAVKRLPLDDVREHAVFRGLEYTAIKQPKTCVFSAQTHDFAKFDGENLSEFLTTNFSGFSRITANEFSAQYKLKPEHSNTIISLINKFENIATSKDFLPCVINNEVYPFPYTTLLKKENSLFTSFVTMSEALDFQYGKIDNEVRIRAKIKHLESALKRVRDRTKRYMSANFEKLKECENMDIFRVYGELIVSNIYKVKRGDKTVIVDNYYTNEQIEIPLDEKLSPAQNSTAYFNKYNKLKRTKIYLEKKMVEDELLLNYLNSISESISQVKLSDNIDDIENELKEIGAIKTKREKSVPNQSSKKSNKQQKAEPPVQYEYKGFKILKGKNNIQNDNLTFKIASSSDVWLHMKNAHGAHVIILCEGKKPPEEVIKFAAEITASNSTASIEVDFTERKNVRRIPQGHPGQVNYTNYKTLTVEPNSHPEFLV